MPTKDIYDKNKKTLTSLVDWIFDVAKNSLVIGAFIVIAIKTNSIAIKLISILLLFALVLIILTSLPYRFAKISLIKSKSEWFLFFFILIILFLLLVGIFDVLEAYRSGLVTKL
jgi:hypothetical protein